MVWDSSDRVELGSIPALTLYKHADAVGRRSRLPQLVCKGKPCDLYQPEVVRCTKLPGGSGTNIDWKVSAVGRSKYQDSLTFWLSVRGGSSRILTIWKSRS